MDANGIATVGLSVGNTPGTVEVTADCGDFGSEVLEVVVGAAGLPPTGAGGRDGSSGNAVAMALAALAAAAMVGAGGLRAPAFVARTCRSGLQPGVDESIREGAPQ